MPVDLPETLPGGVPATMRAVVLDAPGPPEGRVYALERGPRAHADRDAGRYVGELVGVP